MALNNHKKGQPWTTQYPRRADGGWKDGNNVRSQLYSASIALDSTLYNAVDGYDPCDLHTYHLSWRLRNRRPLNLLYRNQQLC